jgi:hypothetical protein
MQAPEPTKPRIAPANVWQTLTPMQQQHVSQTIVAICQQWLATQQERSDDHAHPSKD